MITTRSEQSSDRVLVIGPAWVGDMVMAQSLFITLKTDNPAAEIDVLAPGWTLPLLARMPEVTTPIATPFVHGKLQLKGRYRLARQLSRSHYQRAIILPNSFKAALVPFWAGIPRRTGYVGEQRWGLVNDIRRLDPIRLPMTAQRFVALAGMRDQAPPNRATIPQPCLVADGSSVQRTLESLTISQPSRPVLALCPGAEYGPAKCWPVDYFAAVAQHKLNAGWQVWLLGSSNDAAASDAVNRRCTNRCLDCTGRTTLEQAIDLLSLATLVVSNDSGLMHVAAALNRPTIALYGSSDPGMTPPLSESARVLWLGLECSPCFKRTCPLGHLNCLRELTPDQVLAAADPLVQSRARGP